MSTLSITPQQIIDHRQSRKDTGMVGCISGRPAPKLDFFGYKDVQIWNRDASGRLNGQEGFNRMDPFCFCFDCRSAFDPHAEVDTELVNTGHKQARWTYASLLPADMVPPHPEVSNNNTSSELFCMENPPSLRMPSCSSDDTNEDDEVEGSSILRLPSNTYDDIPDAPSCKRQGSETYNGVTLHITPPVVASHIPLSLPAPRVRDIMNETPQERLRGDLATLRGKISSQLVRVMDSRRRVIFYEPNEDDTPARRAQLAADRATFLQSVDMEESQLHSILDAIDLLSNV